MGAASPQDKYDLEDISDIVSPSYRCPVNWLLWYNNEHHGYKTTCKFYKEDIEHTSKVCKQKVVWVDSELYVVARIVFPNGEKITVETHIPSDHWVWSFSSKEQLTKKQRKEFFNEQ